MARNFYCNHCGKKVARNAAKCPSCGRYFGAILCPKCGYSGSEGEFSGGCPSCGYLGDRAEPAPARGGRDPRKRTVLNLPPLFFAVGILILGGLLVFLLSLWL